MAAIITFEEKYNTNKYLTILFILFATIGGTNSAIGQEDTGPPYNDPPPDFTPANSIDGNLWLLIVIALLLGYYFIKRNNHQVNE